MGCLIPDAEYDIKMEGKGVQANGVAKAIFPTFAKEAQAKFLTRDIFKDGFGLEVDDLLKEKHEEQHKKIKLLNALQDTHDNYEPESWRDRLNVVERYYMIPKPLIVALITSLTLNTIAIGIISVLTFKAYSECNTVNETVKDPVKSLKELLKKPSTTP